MRTILLIAIGVAGCEAASVGAMDLAQALDTAAGAGDLGGGVDLAAGARDQAVASPDVAMPAPDLTHSDLAGFVCYDPGSSFPSFARDCTVDADCYAAIHQVDCCGSHTARGIRRAQSGAFEAAETHFRIVCPALCECVPRPTVCDDGKTAPDDRVTVSCDGGLCVTHGL